VLRLYFIPAGPKDSFAQAATIANITKSAPAGYLYTNAALAAAKPL